MNTAFRKSFERDLNGRLGMNKLEEIEMAVSALPEPEYVQFRRWFLEQDWEKWDREIEADSSSGKLEFLIREAREEKIAGRLRNL